MDSDCICKAFKASPSLSQIPKEPSGSCPGSWVPRIPSGVVPQHAGLASRATTSNTTSEFTRRSQNPCGTWWGQRAGAPTIPKTGITLTTVPGLEGPGQPWKTAYGGKVVVSSPEQEESKQREDIPYKHVPEGCVLACNGEASEAPSNLKTDILNVS